MPAARDNDAIRDLDYRAGESLRAFAIANAAGEAATEIQTKKPGDYDLVVVAVGDTERFAEVADRTVEGRAVVQADIAGPKTEPVQQRRIENMGPVDHIAVNLTFRAARAQEVEPSYRGVVLKS